MTPAIDLSAQQHALLRAILRRFIPDAAVWAYGSRVRFNARRYADLDLVVFTPPTQRRAVSELKDALAESNFPFMVDLQVWDQMPESFQENIRKEYVVVQEAETKQPTRDNLP